MKKNVRFYTLGCKTNQYETQAIREDLKSTCSFAEVGPYEKADTYIINTCTVTAKADRDSRWLIRRCYRENPDGRIVVTGCLTEKDEDMIRDLPGVSFIIKNNEKYKIARILTNSQKPTINNPLTYTPLNISDFQNHTKAFIKIQDGCDNRCSYCKIPLVRGRSRSRRIDDILQEIDRLLNNGFKELVLTGICLGDWGRDLKENLRLSDLIKRIDEIDKDFRLRLSSIEPNMVTDELIEAIARSKKVCHHLHIPLQSGSDKILKLMNRPYNVIDFIELIKKIKKTIPGISITSDVMIGFPKEEKRDFNQTLKLIRYIIPSRLHIFTYSQRRGTAAERLKRNLSFEELKERRKILEDTAAGASYKYRRDLLDKRVRGLVETKRDPMTSLLTGYTDTYIKFLLDGPDSLMGGLHTLKISNVDKKSTFCIYLPTTS